MPAALLAALAVAFIWWMVHQWQVRRQKEVLRIKRGRGIYYDGQGKLDPEQSGFYPKR